MKECQGPAFWAYNDAVFTDDDFENITKLSGATKESKTEMIGRFGLGFNAVYNITDVPSFISRHNIVIFDPHTTHLGKSIKNKSKPGIKIDMRKHRRKLRRLGNQFKPFNNVFGCDLRTEAAIDSYNATLFRFPLRTKTQAHRSEICQKHYDHSEVRSLLQLLVKGAESLLLFTQNVTEITLYHLPPHAKDATHATEVFKVCKTPVKILRELDYPIEISDSAKQRSSSTQVFVKQNNILKASKHAINQIRTGKQLRDLSIPNSSSIILVDCMTTTASEKLLQCSKYSSQAWMVTSVFGTANSLRMALMEDNMLPSAGVAVPLRHNSNTDTYTPEPIVHPENNTQHFGTIFSYLPMPIHSGLPLHINGAFAVTSNRRQLCERNEDDKFDMRAIWNEALMEDSVCQAYSMLLEDIAKIASPGQFTKLWPQIDSVESNSTTLQNSFYRTMSDCSDECLPVYSNETKWVSLQNAVFLSPHLKNSCVGSAMCDVFKQCTTEKSEVLIDLPERALRGFQLAKCDEAIQDRTYGLARFFEEIFIPNINEINAHCRDPIVLYALDNGDQRVRKLIQDCACIPVSPSGEGLKRPSELIDPNSELAYLYTPSDGKFPYGKLYSSKKTLNMIHALGMAREDIPWDDVIERAESIVSVDYSIGRKRAQTLLTFIEKKLMMIVHEDESEQENMEEYQDKLRAIPMIPILGRPKHVDIQWMADGMSEDQFLAAKDIYPQAIWPLVCCVKPVADETVFPIMNESVKTLLNLKDVDPGLETVLEQLICVIDDGQAVEDRESQEQLTSACIKIYEYLQNVSVKDIDKKQKIIEAIQDKPFIFCSGQFLLSKHVAFHFPHHCAPYLYGLQDMIRRAAEGLLLAVGVRETFETTDFVEALRSMHDICQERTLDKGTLKLALRLVNLLNDSISDLDQTLEDVTLEYGTIFIPDAESVLRPASELCYNEPNTNWLPTDNATKLSHQLIPYAISKQLGVNTRRQEVLKKHSRGIPFGQRERLTNRLKRILASYPCDKEILKELLQNSDDANASEIHFIKDARQHPKERVFDESWKPLQGPALCVYNDSPFTDLDLQGIQRLGEGSKTNDPNKTGQYGVGFNCVYHLTDAPSFLTCRPHVGESLCVFDPHGKYVPGATIDEPGRRYDDVAELRQIFTDVFPCYLGDKFNLENATMFRFPLRTSDMAYDSELSDQPFPVEMLDTLFSKFKAEIYDCLLFVNSVRTISISEMDKLTNRLTNTYTVTVEISEDDQHQRKNFQDNLRKIAQDLKEGNMEFWEIPAQEIAYEMKMSDNRGTWEKWLVVQRVGYEKGTKLPPSLYDAFKKKELALLPRGGVAALLDASSDQFTRSRKAFCFLPLPIKTDLPVQINGHFALDHEARRNLWLDEDTGPKTDWNLSLLNDVIARAYVSLLSLIPAHISNSTPVDSDTSFFQIEDDNVPDIDFYSDLFPRFNSTHLYWKSLVTAVYKTIDASQEPVLPVLKVCVP